MSPNHTFKTPLPSSSVSISITLFLSSYSYQMGLCSSNNAASAAVATAKLILPDGRLVEYSQPIKAYFVLQRLKSSEFFICNADEMEFDDVVLGLEEDEEIRLGELYFVLPLGALRRKLKAEEMAELAVRASAALVTSCGGAWASAEGGGGKMRRGVAEEGRRRRNYFNEPLSVIPE